ncbi:MAG: enoyl-CoA hydratase/isomerase family protein [Planctomycetes bacterium]|nr:enoyl-CoA hydratase/isomerase family protein [Planctomycetota bacterium]
MAVMWHTNEPEDGILKVRIDYNNRPVNLFSKEALKELSELVDQINSNASITGVLFYSSKPGNFIAGADINEFKDLGDEAESRVASEFGQTVFQKVEDLKVPTVVLISGSCLGGGLEFSLACNYRIAADAPKTLIGLPEVKLGLIPGWGGTVRLPRQIGLIKALPMILAGQMLNAYQARSRGVVDDVVPPEALLSVGEKILKVHRDKGSAASLFRPKRSPFWKRAIENSGFVQKYALNQAEKQTRATTHGHYPAPQAAIETLRDNLGVSESIAFANEAKTIARLGNDPVTTECIRLFFLQEESKKPPESLDVPIKPEMISQAAVIGAGAMGAGIALLFAKKGVWTRLKDLKPEYVSNGMKTVRKLLNTEVKRRRLTKLQATKALDRISPTVDYRGLKHADIVIEAVLEDLEIKRQVFRELAEATGPETVLATNTSSILVSDIAKDIPHPERVVGLHFFNPPHKMPLVEIIRTEQTSPQALATAIAAVSRIGKTKVVVGDCAGFLVNRLLSPYMNEAGHLLTEVDDPLEIERAAVDFGMPMGPLELTELVGIDVAAHVAENMHVAYGERMAPAPLWQRLKQMRLAEDNSETRLFESDKRGKRIKKLTSSVARVIRQMKTEQSVTGPSPSQETIIQRLVYPVINEAARCLEEGIVESHEEIDLAMVFGTGFAPFRGGPMRYAGSIGFDHVVRVLDQFAEKHPRLAPSDALRQLAQEGYQDPVPFREPAAATV